MWTRTVVSWCLELAAVRTEVSTHSVKERLREVSAPKGLRMLGFSRRALRNTDETREMPIGKLDLVRGSSFTFGSGRC